MWDAAAAWRFKSAGTFLGVTMQFTRFLPFDRPRALSPPSMIFALLGLSLTAVVSVHAETSLDLRDRQLYDFEQCASACQIELDRQLLHCPEYSDDSDNVDAQRCHSGSRERYQQCLAMCPADPRQIGTDLSM